MKQKELTKEEIEEMESCYLVEYFSLAAHIYWEDKTEVKK